MKLLNLFQCICLSVYLIGCSGNNASLFRGDSQVGQGASQSGDGTNVGGGGLAGGGTVGDGTGGGSTDPTKVCQHPEARDFSTEAGEAGACVFEACTDTNFLESLKVEDFQLYIDKYGGSIISNPDLCKSHLCSPELCQHPDASNFQLYGKCEFTACTKDTYLEYHTYLSYKAFVDKHGGEIEHDQNLCLNEVKVTGCTIDSAIETDEDANYDDCSCKWKACLDPLYEEYEQADNKQKLEDIAQYVSDHGGEVADYVTESTCKKLIAVEGCLDPLADNTTIGANTENKTCKYTYCNDPAYKEYDTSKAKRDAAQKYSLEQTLALPSISINSCKEKKPYCADDRATNKGKYEVCHYEVCTDPRFEEYSFYQEILILVSQGQASYTANNDKKCETLKPVYGCMQETANNTTADATVENGKCRWDTACLDPNYEEYSDPANKALVDIIRAYATQHSVAASSIVDQSTCSTPVVVTGCTEVGAVGYNPAATQDDKSCKFNLCGDCQYPTFDTPANLAIIEKANAYADAHGLLFSEVVGTSTCEDPYNRAGCMNPLALNYDGGANVEAKNCQFKACLKCDSYQQHAEYSSEIEQIILDYNQLNGVSAPVYDTCKKNIYTLRVKFDASCLTKIQVAKLKVSFSGGSQSQIKYLTTPQPELRTYHLSKGTDYVIESLSPGFTISGQSTHQGILDDHELINVSCE